MFKPTVIFVFISSLLVQFGFVSLYTIFEIRKHKKAVKILMKAELKKGLHNADLTLFSEKDLEYAEWEHSKEFFLGEEKYDVVKIETTKDGKVYHCVNDKKEIELYKSLDKNKKQKSLLDDMLKKFCAFSVYNQKNDRYILSTKENLFGLVHDGYESQYQSSILRPPIQLS